jgi:hypothetical protein
MKRYCSSFTLALLISLSASACLPAPGREPEPAPGPGPSAYQAAAAALQRGEFARADTALHRVSFCDATPQGQEALLLLVSSALDPRNPRRSPTNAMRYAAHYLRIPAATPEGRARATALYLIALELGADSSQARRAPPHGEPALGSTSGLAPECARVAAADLLDFPGLQLDVPTVEQRIRTLEAQRQDLTQRLRTSESFRAALEKQLAEVTTELERIRQILRQ